MASWQLALRKAKFGLDAESLAARLAGRGRDRHFGFFWGGPVDPKKVASFFSAPKKPKKANLAGGCAGLRGKNGSFAFTSHRVW
jgi:hypothetical protein